MIVDTCDYTYDDVELLDSLDPYELPFSPWDKFTVESVEPFGCTFEELQTDLPESLCCTRNLMWGSGPTDLEDETKISPSLERPATPVPTTVKATPPPPTVASSTPPNQRSLLIKSQPHYNNAVSSDLYSPPISDDEDEDQTSTLKMLGDHIKECNFKDILDFNNETDYMELLETICEKLVDNDVSKIFAPPQSPRSQSPPSRPSFEMDHCYSKEAEPEDDGPYDSNLGVDTPSETEDEEEIERADESFELEDEKEQDDYEEEKEAKYGKRMANMVKEEDDDDDDEEEEIDVVSVSDHSVDIRGGINSYLYPKANISRNVYGSFGTIPKKTLPIPERKCVNGKYIPMDMEVPTPAKRNVGRIAPKPVSKKRRQSSSDDEDEDDDDDSDSESSYKHSYSRYGSRKSRSPPKKRRTSDDVESGSDKRNLHNSLERMRRIGLKNLFDTLRNSIPSISQRERTAKVVILNTATTTVTQVQRQEEKYAAEKVALKRKQEALRKRLSELRKSAARFR